MRQKKFIRSTVATLVKYFIFTVIGFVLPRMTIEFYGSEVNGLVNSISQFVNYISLLEMGFVAVVASALYAPLAHGDQDEVSRVVVSCDKFYKKLSYILVGYSILVMIIYPFLIDKKYEYVYVASLVFSLALNKFLQYYFGVTWTILLKADQKPYINYYVDSLVAFLNFVISMVLIKKGFSIQLVKLISAGVFFIKPVLLMIYVKKHYNINSKIDIKGEPIKQKRNGMAQHLAFTVFSSTDMTVLTIFSSLKMVSIYSVYYSLVDAVSGLLKTLTDNVTAVFGELLSKNEQEKIRTYFFNYNCIIHYVVVVVFATVATSICSFVHVYTKGITDINYQAPGFAVVLTIAYAVYIIRVPYNQMIHAAGHYKETQNSAWIEMMINIVVSILMVIKFDILGVAIGTLCAMIYRTVYFVWYLSKYILNISPRIFVRMCMIDFCCIALICIEALWLKNIPEGYFELCKDVVIRGLIFGISAFIIFLLFYHKNMREIFKMMKKRV